MNMYQRGVNAIQDQEQLTAPMTITLLLPTEAEIKNQAQVGRYYPEFRFKVGDLELFTFEVQPRRYPGPNKTRKDRAIRLRATLVNWSVDNREIFSIFWYLYYFRLTDQPYIMALFCMGWEPELIGAEQRRALIALKEFHKLDVPYTLCMACGASGKENDDCYCEVCQGLGSYVLYDEDYFNRGRE